MFGLFVVRCIAEGGGGWKEVFSALSKFGKFSRTRSTADWRWKGRRKKREFLHASGNTASGQRHGQSATASTFLHVQKKSLQPICNEQPAASPGDSEALE